MVQSNPDTASGSLLKAVGTDGPDRFRLRRCVSIRVVRNAKPEALTQRLEAYSEHAPFKLQIADLAEGVFDLWRQVSTEDPGEHIKPPYLGRIIGDLAGGAELTRHIAPRLCVARPPGSSKPLPRIPAGRLQTRP